MGTLSKDTKITIGSAVAITGFMAGALWTGINKLNSMDHQLEVITSRIGQSEIKLTEYYLLTAASEQALRMAIENPGLRVPDPRDPSKIIHVRSNTP